MMKIIIALLSLLWFVGFANAGEKESLITEVEKDVDELIKQKDVGKLTKQKDYEKVQSCLEEIIKNEVNYLNHMNILLLLYSDPFKKTTAKWKSNVNLLLELIKPIREMSRDFVDSWFDPKKTNNIDVRIPLILKPLIDNQEKFKELYVPYAIASEENNLVKFEDEDSNIDAVRNKLSDIGYRWIELENFIRLPTHRLMQYQLTLSELQKHYIDWDSEGKHLSLIKEAIETFSKIALLINTEQAIFLVKKKLIHVTNLPEIQLEKFKNGRLPDFVAELDLNYYLQDDRSVKLHAYVFTGFMVLAKRKKLSKDYEFDQVIYFTNIKPSKLFEDAFIVTDKKDNKLTFFGKTEEISDLLKAFE